MEQRVGRQAETCPKHDTREATSFGANAATSLGARSIFPRSIFQGSPPSGSSQPIRYLGMLGTHVLLWGKKTDRARRWATRSTCQTVPEGTFCRGIVVRIIRYGH